MFRYCVSYLIGFVDAHNADPSLSMGIMLTLLSVYVQLNFDFV